MRSFCAITLAILVVMGPFFPGITCAKGMLKKSKLQAVAPLETTYQPNDCKFGWWQTLENGKVRPRWALVCR